jgi:hypothetical protein
MTGNLTENKFYFEHNKKILNKIVKKKVVIIIFCFKTNKVYVANIAFVRYGKAAVFRNKNRMRKNAGQAGCRIIFYT